MGCDIHAVIEFADIKRLETGEVDEWRHLGAPNLMRNYGLFNCLAGVRRYHDEWPEPIAEPRGVPKDCSYKTRENYLLYIVDRERCSCGGERGYVNKENAERYLKSGSSMPFGDKYVTDPDAHSASFLFLHEVKEAYQRFRDYFKDHEDKPVGPEEEFEAVIACMESLEKNGNKTRLVFWFDN